MDLKTIATFGLTGVVALAMEMPTATAQAGQPSTSPGRVRVTAKDVSEPPKKPAARKTTAGTKLTATKPTARSLAGKSIVPIQYTDSAERPRLPAGGTDVPGSPGAAAADRESMQGPLEHAADDDDPLQALLEQSVTPIDLPTALQLAGEQNPLILLGQERVVEAVAMRQLAAAQFLPTLNLGTSVDAHWGVLQQSNGNILTVQREDVFVGAGAYAIAAGTVNIPGVMWNLNISDTVFNFLASRQEVDRREFASQATRQDVLLTVSLAYNDLVRAEGMRSIAIVTRNDARELARLTAAYEKSGEGRKADADRAATELASREARLYDADGTVVQASASLSRVLHLDPSIRLHAAENQVIPRSIVPDPISLPELLAIALMHRPELNERRAAAAKALTNLRGARTLPFSPTVLVGFSTGGFGGGSNLVAQPTTSIPWGRNEPRFGKFADREDLDVMAYWTLLNLGVGNKAQIDAARSRLSSADFELLITLDQIRAEVASAQARTHSRFAQIRSCELAVKSGMQALEEDMERIRGGEGLPLEVINSLRQLARSRDQYLASILDYNKAQFQLYVALGKPPAELLMRPADDNAIAPLPPQPAP